MAYPHPSKQRMVGTKWRIFSALCEHPYGLTMPELIECVYGHREDGGPETAERCITVNLWLLRGWLKYHYPLLTHRVRSPGRRHVLFIGK